MFTGYLAAARIKIIREALLSALGYDAGTRSALLSGLPLDYRSLMPGSTAPPAIALQLDLDYLNTTSRLIAADLLPVIPLQTFLDNALGFISQREEASPVREAIAAIEGTASGAPPVSTDGVDVTEAIVVRDDMLPLDYLADGVLASAAVARLLVPRIQDSSPQTISGRPLTYRGTGWLLGRGLLITNLHVINARDQGEAGASEPDLRLQVAAMEVLFDYDDDRDSDEAPGTRIAAVELVAFDADLDFAVIRLAGDDRPPLRLSPGSVDDVSASRAMAVNVIQHPEGRPKRLAIRNNLVAAATPTELRYFTDTLGGSSGSPVLDDCWRVVGLHRGSTFVRGVKFQGHDVAYLNVGTQISAIITHLEGTHPQLLTEIGV